MTEEYFKTAEIKLDYHIYHCTSEDPEYPVHRIQDDVSVNNLIARNSEGWVTKKFCSFP